MSRTALENYRLLTESIEDVALSCGRVPQDISLVVVTKNRPWEEIAPLYNAGQQKFAESRQKELCQKMAQAPLDVDWHFIGNLQRKMIPKLMGVCGLIHSVTSYEVAAKIAACSQEYGICTHCLLEVNTSAESEKLGLTAAEWRLKIEKILALPSISVVGLMTMAPLQASKAEQQSAARQSFAALRLFRDELVQTFAIELPHLSMGMSGDYVQAIQEGSTLLRIGSAIFETAL